MDVDTMLTDNRLSTFVTMMPYTSFFLLVGSIVIVGACASKDALPSNVSSPSADGGSDASALPDVAADAALPDSGVTPAAFANVPNLVFCAWAADPWAHHDEMSPTITRYQSCATTCDDWTMCTHESTVRGKPQVEVAYVVDEDGKGNGFGGTIRFTKDGARDRVVLFHKGGAGTEYVDDDLPQKVEGAGGTVVEPKWVEETDTKVGWFSRPFAGSKLEKNLFGVSLRPAAIFKWIFLNLSTTRFSTVGCSGGSIATYYPRHWHGLDDVLRYQLLSGGPVMSKIEAGCGGKEKLKGRCTLAPTIECTMDAQCGAGGGTCSPYMWRKLDLVMKAVRDTIDHLHAQATNGSTDCNDGNPQPAFDISDFDSPMHPFDSHNEHPIDFMANVGSTHADDYLNVLASGAAVYSGLTGAKTWTVQTSGVHCDSFKTDEAWNLLKAGAGL